MRPNFALILVLIWMVCVRGSHSNNTSFQTFPEDHLHTVVVDTQPTPSLRGSSRRYDNSSSSSGSGDEGGTVRRRLSAVTEPLSGQLVQTVNGHVPTLLCPVGFYRLAGNTDRFAVTAPRLDGCLKCPRGTYGQIISGTPCVNCPLGKYGDEVGLKSVHECQFCPQGRYGVRSGLTTSSCTGKCPAGKFSDLLGSTSPLNCVKCHATSHQWQCRQAVQPRSAVNPPIVAKSK
jgi:hypothetical protein